MSDSIIVNIIFSFVLLLVGLMFLEGIWQKKGTIVKSKFNIDNYIFPNMRDKRILKSGDQLAFLLCLGMSLLTLVNGILSLFFENLPNFSAIFIFVGVVLSWPVRIIYIFLKRNKSYEEIARIWPFSK